MGYVDMSLKNGGHCSTVRCYIEEWEREVGVDVMFSKTQAGWIKFWQHNHNTKTFQMRPSLTCYCVVCNLGSGHRAKRWSQSRAVFRVRKDTSLTSHQGTTKTNAFVSDELLQRSRVLPLFQERGGTHQEPSNDTLFQFFSNYFLSPCAWE